MLQGGEVVILHRDSFGSEAWAWHRGNIPGTALSDQNGARRVQIVDITASGMPDPPVKGSAEDVLQSLHLLQDTFFQRKEMWGCAQPCTGHPGRFPACAHGDAEHYSHTGCGKSNIVSRKVLSSFYFFLHCPSLNSSPILPCV